MEVCFENLTFFFLQADDVCVIQSFELFFDAILIGCRVRGIVVVSSTPMWNSVLPREVAQAAKVSTALVSQNWSRDVGKELPGFHLCILVYADPKHNWKPSQHACSFRGCLRDNHRTNGLSTIDQDITQLYYIEL